MAQTTRFASFGPVFLIAAQPKPAHRFITRIEPKKNKKKQVKHEQKKKPHTYGPNNAKRVIWARFSHRCPTESSPSF